MDLLERQFVSALSARDVEGVVAGFYQLMPSELLSGEYSEHELSMMHDPVNYYGGFLDQRARRYALRGATKTLRRAADALGLADQRGPRKLLDIGSGLGNPSLILSLLGAEVHGIDLNPEAVRLATKRKAYYEKRLGMRIEAEFEVGNFPEMVDSLLSHRYDAVFSYSSIIYMWPMTRVVNGIARILKPGGRLAIWDKNCGFPRKIFTQRNRMPSPAQLRRLLQAEGLQIHTLTGAVAIPRRFWHDNAFPLLQRLDDFLTRSHWLSHSFFMAGQKPIT